MALYEVDARDLISFTSSMLQRGIQPSACVLEFGRIPASHKVAQALDVEVAHQVFAANPYCYKVDTAGNQLPYIDELYQSYAPDKELIELKIINGEADQKAQTLQIASLLLYKQHQEVTYEPH